ncbi:MAG TPA: LamG-like jellyroll fold domain-containing protein, partial [Phyllobacterium sp.]|nr:LamG-like jellyroll fold domain-containing protein [Phyllobacterium sp.]
MGRLGSLWKSRTSPPSPPAGLALSFLPAGSTSVPNVSVTQAALNFERTQSWSLNCQVQVPGPPTAVAAGGGTAAIIFTTCNQGPGSTFPGYEVWINASGTIQVRLISNITANNYIGVFGAINVCDNNLHNVAVSYDGSSTIGGIKIYVDGVLDTNTSEGFALTASILNAQPLV